MYPKIFRGSVHALRFQVLRSNQRKWMLSLAVPANHDKVGCSGREADLDGMINAREEEWRRYCRIAKRFVTKSSREEN